MGFPIGSYSGKHMKVIYQLACICLNVANNNKAIRDDMSANRGYHIVYISDSSGPEVSSCLIGISIWYYQKLRCFACEISKS